METTNKKSMNLRHLNATYQHEFAKLLAKSQQSALEAVFEELVQMEAISTANIQNKYCIVGLAIASLENCIIGITTNSDEAAESRNHNICKQYQRLSSVLWINYKINVIQCSLICDEVNEALKRLFDYPDLPSKEDIVSYLYC